MRELQGVGIICICSPLARHASGPTEGKVDERNLAKEMLTREELLGKLREQNVEKIADVRLAQFEGDGRLSVIKKEK